MATRRAHRAGGDLVPACCQRQGAVLRRSAPEVRPTAAPRAESHHPTGARAWRPKRPDMDQHVAAAAAADADDDAGVAATGAKPAAATSCAVAAATAQVPTSPQQLCEQLCAVLRLLPAAVGTPSAPKALAVLDKILAAPASRTAARFLPWPQRRAVPRPSAPRRRARRHAPPPRARLWWPHARRRWTSNLHSRSSVPHQLAVGHHRGLAAGWGRTRPPESALPLRLPPIAPSPFLAPT